MHENLLYSVIKDQAGSLWKAIIEGIMNAIDAGSSKCEIELTQQMLIIRDDGKGFASKKEITKFFEVFGQPHAAAEQKKFGKFRMGRGQLFAYGRNIWRSGKFEMTIDIKKDGLDWDLRTGLPHQDGCTVTVQLYDTLTNVLFDETAGEIERNAKYVETPTYLNSRQFNKPPATQKWDHELPEADVKLRSRGALCIYNQGILVCETYRMGLSGDVVSKIPIRVNFARNDVMSDCPVWMKIRKAISKQTVRRTTSPRAQLTDADRDRLASLMRDGDLSVPQLEAAKFLRKYTTHAHVNIRTATNFADGRVTMPPGVRAVPDEDAFLDSIKIMSHKLAFVIDREALARFRCEDGKTLVTILNGYLGPYTRSHMRWVDFETLADGLPTTHSLLDEGELTKNEAITLEVLQKNQRMLLGHVGRDSKRNMRLAPKVRRIVVGLGPRDAWTDGSSYIAISRPFIKKTRMHPTAWQRYAHVLMHQYLHDEPTFTEHKHNAIFYQNYHAWSTSYAMSYFSYNCTVTLAKHATNIRKRLTRTVLARSDAVMRSAKTADAEEAAPSTS